MFKTAKQLKRQYQCITFHFLESLIENQEFSGYQFYLTTSVMQTVSFNWFLSQWQKSEKCIFSKSKMSSAFFYFRIYAFFYFRIYAFFYFRIYAFFYFRIYGPYHTQNACTHKLSVCLALWHKWRIFRVIKWVFCLLKYINKKPETKHRAMTAAIYDQKPIATFAQSSGSII